MSSAYVFFILISIEFQVHFIQVYLYVYNLSIVQKLENQKVLPFNILLTFNTATQLKQYMSLQYLLLNAVQENKYWKCLTFF